MPEILSSIACNLDAEILSASYPLFEESRVDAIEWAFDALFQVEQIPSWFSELLTAYSRANRLIGHGVFFSLFSGKWRPEQEAWLRHLQRTCDDLPFDHITEHFGFMTGKDFHHGAPLNIPYSASTLRIGQDRIKRIYEACRCPVGLENLAFSYSPEEVRRHGAFLEELLHPVNGFIILDLHNLYCQISNFSIGYDELITLYPLHRVREIHISGGSWQEAMIDPGRTIRRDTHDDAVPEDVFALLERTIGKCPNLKYVVLEQLGTGLQTKARQAAFYEDFLTMGRIVQAANRAGAPAAAQSFLPLFYVPPGGIVEDEKLYGQQLELSYILETSGSYGEVVHLLEVSSLAYSDWGIEKWDPAMIETAMRIAQKWKKIK